MMLLCLLLTKMSGGPFYSDYLLEKELVFLSEYSKSRNQLIGHIFAHFPLVQFQLDAQSLLAKGVIFADNEKRVIASYFVFHGFDGVEELTNAIITTSKTQTLEFLKNVLTLIAGANEFNFLPGANSYSPELEMTNNRFNLKIIDYKPNRYHHISIKGEFDLKNFLKTVAFDEKSFSF